MDKLRVTVVVLNLVVELALGLTECNTTGVFASDRPEKFCLCTQENQALIRSEFSCSNDTVYSGKGAQCISTKLKDTTFHYYTLINSNINANIQPEVTLNCISPGTICSDCNTLSVCAGDLNPSGEFQLDMISNNTCAKGEHCAMGQGCTSSLHYPCSSGSFQCDDAGVFPDPYDCQKYHWCSAASLSTPLTYRCSSGSFNATTASCGFSMLSNSCTNRPVPLCRELFQLGQVTDAPSMFYICVQSRTAGDTLTPSLHRCPMNQMFDPVKKSCV